MITNQDLIREYIQDAHDQIAVALSTLALEKTDKSHQNHFLLRQSWDVEHSPGKTLFQILQSIRVGACFLGFQQVTFLVVLLKEMLLFQQYHPNMDELKVTSVQESILIGFKRLKSMLNNIYMSDRVSLDNLVKQCHQWGMPLSKPKMIVSPLERQYFLDKNQKYFDVLIHIDEDLIEKGRDALEFLQHMENIASILDSRIEMQDLAPIQHCLQANLSVHFYVTSSSEIYALANDLDVPSSQIREVTI